MVQAYAILASIHVVVYLAETFFSLRKYTNNLDFSGEAFRNGKVYVGVTSVRFRNRNPTTSILNFDLHAPQTFLHNSNEHVLEQVMSLLIAGEAVEQRLGSGYLFAFAYILCGFVGCVASWQIFGMYPPPHLRNRPVVCGAAVIVLRVLRATRVVHAALTPARNPRARCRA